MKAKKLTAGVCVFALALGSAAPAIAHDCVVAKKPGAAGAVGSFNVATGEETLLKNNPGSEDSPHGAFFQITDGAEFDTSVFIRAPEGVIPAARPDGPQYNCDGKGLDNLSACE